MFQREKDLKEKTRVFSAPHCIMTNTLLVLFTRNDHVAYSEAVLYVWIKGHFREQHY